MGTNSAFPDGIIPNVEIKENERAVALHDDSDAVKAIRSAKEFNLVFDEETDELTGVQVIKTREQHQLEEDAKPENILKRVREKRNQLLRDSDYLMLSDAPITGQQKADAVLYRQALRDITNQDINNIIFPDKPFEF